MTILTAHLTASILFTALWACIGWNLQSLKHGSR